MSLLAFWLLLQQGDAFAEGLRAYGEARYADALQTFAAAEQAAGEAAMPELSFNHALSALAVGAWTRAEEAAERAAARGGPEFAAAREFVRGNAAYGRMKVAEAQAAAVESEPFAYDAAIAYAEAARRAWQEAAVLDPARDGAARNVERALRKLDELRKKKAEAARRTRAESRPKPEPEPEPAPKEGPKTQVPANRPKPAVTELAPDDVPGLAEKLAAKEREKRRVRAADRRAATPAAERDW
jgi:hypothetical protein